MRKIIIGIAALAAGLAAAVPAQAMAGPTAAPYIDITMPSPSLVDVANATGQKVFTLAFVLADSSGCNPSWGGTIPLDDARIIGDIQALRAMGGEVIVATGDAVIAAAESVLGQMRTVWPSMSDADLRRHLGVTPMIGRNYNGRIFDQSDARQLVDWGNANHLGRLAFWSAGRDNGSCPGGGVSPTCSSITQSDYEFTTILRGFTG